MNDTPHPRDDRAAGVASLAATTALVMTTALGCGTAEKQAEVPPGTEPTASAAAPHATTIPGGDDEVDDAPRWDAGVRG